jgi:hypothetical protein
MYNINCVFFYILCNKNILSLIGKIYEKYSDIIGEVVAILAHFDKVINDVSQKDDRVETNYEKEVW